jgi:thymidylate synthase (FAD)
MESIDYDDRDEQRVQELRDYTFPKDHETFLPNQAATHAFIEKQLSRGHFGLWEHPQITIAIEGVSRATMAQITRHRHMTFDVQSQRYVDFSDKEPLLPKSLMDEANISREVGLSDLDDRTKEKYSYLYEERAQEAFEAYQSMVDAGVPKEDARFVLPVGTPVNITMSGNARTMMHVLNLRQKANAQWEIRELSNMIVDELKEWMPYTAAWWEENGPVKISP